MGAESDLLALKDKEPIVGAIGSLWGTGPAWTTVKLCQSMWYPFNSQRLASPGLAVICMRYRRCLKSIVLMVVAFSGG